MDIFTRSQKKIISQLKNDGLTVVEGSLEAKQDLFGDRKRKFQKISIFGDLGTNYLIWAYRTMLCTNHCFDNTLSKNDSLTVVEGSLEAKWDPLGDRKGKYQKYPFLGSLRS